MKRISVFGLGRVGHVLAICLADAGHSVTGFDVNTELINDLQSGVFTSYEPEVMKKYKRVLNKTFKLTINAEEAIDHSDITCITVPTPSNRFGGFSLRYILSAVGMIGKALRIKNKYHLVSLVSTVMPGSSEHIIIPFLEKASGKKVGKNLGYVYNPAFIALGEVVKGFIEPDYVLIGQSDKKSGTGIVAMHTPMIKKLASIVYMNPTEAEITKLASNTHETMRVSFANMLCALCEQIPHTNVDTITGALTHRMGKRFFKGAIPYGGPCWPRDNQALALFMDSVGVTSIMPLAVDRYNKEYGIFILNKILSLTAKGQTVGILGLSYKPGTPIIDASFGIELSQNLMRRSRRVIVWDPLALDEAKKILGGTISYADKAELCLKRSDAVVIVNNLPDLLTLNWKKAKNKPVLDCWRCLGKKQQTMLQRYISLGRSEDKTHSLLDSVSLKQLIIMTK